MKQNTKEIWVDVPGYEGYYQVSNQGNVKSLDRWVIYKNGRKQFYKGKIMEGSLNNGGYKMLVLSKNDKQRGFNISQLVSMAFLGHKPDGHQLVVDHINGIRSDNRVENLQIVTNRENVSTCYRTNEDSLTSEYVGVCYFKQTDKWQAHIHSNSKIIYLGLFDSEINASNAYQKALSELENGTFNPENYRAKWTSKYKGVSYYKNTKKWQAQSTINGKQVYLGYFNTEVEAFNCVQKFKRNSAIQKFKRDNGLQKNLSVAYKNNRIMKKKMSDRSNRMTVKLNPYLRQKLKDMKLVFGINYSTLIRTMMEAYFQKHSTVIDKLIEDFYEKKKNNNK